MPNITLLSKVLKSVNNSAYSDSIKNLLRHLVKMSKQGIIRNYEQKTSDICQALYFGDFKEYMNDYSILHNDKVLRYDGRNLVILLFTDTYLFKFLYSNNTKRQYIKCTKSSKWKTNTFIDPYSDLANEIQSMQDKGVKIPVSLLDYLMCNPLDEGKDLSPEQILIETQRRSLPNTVRTYYLLLMCLCNSNGIIKDYNCHFASKEINRLFGAHFLSENSAYYAHSKLLEVGLISENFDEASNCNFICIEGYKEGFGPTKRYIVISYSIISDPVFGLITNAANKLMFLLLSRLNNGEDKLGVSLGSDKYVQYKLFPSEDDSYLEKNLLFKLLSFTKKRNSYELNKVISELSHFFDIVPDTRLGDKGYYNIRIKQKYFITKKANSSINIFIRPSERYSKKAAIIKHYLEEYNIPYEEKDYQGMVRTLHRTANNVIRKLIYCIRTDTNLRKINNWPKINNLGAYTYWLYGIYKTDNAIVKDKLSGLFYKMNLEMENEILEDVYKRDHQALNIYTEQYTYYDNIEKDFAI